MMNGVETRWGVCVEAEKEVISVVVAPHISYPPFKLQSTLRGPFILVPAQKQKYVTDGKVEYCCNIML